MNGDSSILVLLEIFSGQLKNMHNQLEQTLLRRMGLDPKAFNMNGDRIQRAQLPDKDKAVSPWYNGEIRTMLVSVTVGCIKSPTNPGLNVFYVEELTSLESMALSIQTSIEDLRRPITREENLLE